MEPKRKRGAIKYLVLLITQIIFYQQLQNN